MPISRTGYLPYDSALLSKYEELYYESKKQIESTYALYGSDSNDSDYIKEGSDIKIIHDDLMVNRTVKAIEDDMVYWEDENEEFSFAPIEKFSRIKNKWILVIYYEI